MVLCTGDEGIGAEQRLGEIGRVASHRDVEGDGAGRAAARLAE